MEQDQPELAEELGVTLGQRQMAEDDQGLQNELPLDEIEISDATVLIDLESLTERNCKRTAAVAFYADLDGFTRYVQEAESDEKVVSLVRQFHMIRAEFHAVVESDYEGLVLQHRGDCILGILHLPCGDDKHEETMPKGGRHRHRLAVVDGARPQREDLKDSQRHSCGRGLGCGQGVRHSAWQKGSPTVDMLWPRSVQCRAAPTICRC